MKKRHFITALISSVLLTTVFCVSVTASNIPEPSESFYVYDEADVISDETEEHIVYQNERLESSTGAQIVIATVKTTGDDTIRNFAGEMFTEWKIGDAEKHNGVLVLLAIDDDDYWVTQGSGIEDKLSSGDIKVMLDTYLEPSFAAKDYDNGVKNLFNNLASTFESIYSVELENVTLPAEGVNPGNRVDANAKGSVVSSILTGFIVVVAVVIFIIIIIVVVRGMSGPRYTRGLGRPSVMIPPRGGKPPHRNINPRPGTRPGTAGAPRPGARPGQYPGHRPGGNMGPRPGSMNRPSGSRPMNSGMGRSGSRPGGRTGGGGSTRGGGAGRR